jgi:flagellar biosynthetic protein FlhB
MASESLPEQKTELPTDRRMGDLRRQGAIYQSADITHTLVLMAGFLGLQYSWNAIYFDMQYVLVKSFQMIADRPSFELNDMTAGFIRLALLMAPDVMMVTIIVGAVAALGVMLQTNWNKREGWIKFRWDFVNPMNGLKRIVSIAGLVNTLKAILKLVFVLPIGYWALQGFAPTMAQLVHTSIKDVLGLTGLALTSVFWKIIGVFGIVAVGDYVWGKFQWFKKNKMTKEEVKDERKSVEGDEASKRKMIAKGLARITQKLKQSVPKADVIVTNPTHYAVALQYDRKRHAAPIVVAKGTDFIALRIREIAKENNIPILERKALARALYSSTEVGTEIPRDLFKAVAEVLAFVYRMKNPRVRRDVGQDR